MAMKLREQPATHLIYDTIWEQILDDFAASKPRQSCSRDDRIIPIFRNGTRNGERELTMRREWWW